MKRRNRREESEGKRLKGRELMGRREGERGEVKGEGDSEGPKGRECNKEIEGKGVKGREERGKIEGETVKGMEEKGRLKRRE